MSDSESQLKGFLEAESKALLGTLRLYVVRAGLASGQGAGPAAAELLNQVAVEALSHADRFRPEGRPRAWLLGIAANLIKREQVARARRSAREPLAHDLVRGSGESMSEDEVFDRLAVAAVADPARELAARQQTEAILSHVSDGDRQVLRLAVLHELNGQELAGALGITPGAARVRLHRALNRLRANWPGYEVAKGESNG